MTSIVAVLVLVVVVVVVVVVVLLIHSQASMVAPMKFVNGYLISSHTL